MAYWETRQQMHEFPVQALLKHNLKQVDVDTTAAQSVVSMLSAQVNEESRRAKIQKRRRISGVR